MIVPVYILQDLINPDAQADVFLTYKEAFVNGKEFVSQNHVYSGQQGSATIGGLTNVLYGTDGFMETEICSIKTANINLNKNKMYDLMHKIESNLHHIVENGETA